MQITVSDTQSWVVEQKSKNMILALFPGFSRMEEDDDDARRSLQRAAGMQSAADPWTGSPTVQLIRR